MAKKKEIRKGTIAWYKQQLEIQKGETRVARELSQRRYNQTDELKRKLEGEESRARDLQRKLNRAESDMQAFERQDIANVAALRERFIQDLVTNHKYTLMNATLEVDERLRMVARQGEDERRRNGYLK